MMQRHDGWRAAQAMRADAAPMRDAAFRRALGLAVTGSGAAVLVVELARHLAALSGA